MKVSEALEKRKSVRAFLPKEVEADKIDRILEYARYAPSGVNTQPWEVAVISGNSKAALIQKLEQAFDDNIAPKMDYQYYPDEWFEPFKTRRKETGLLMYNTIGISREDKERQREQWKENYRAFGAPSILMFFMDRKLGTGSFIDYGMFLQSVLLMAEEEGLATCTQASITGYADIIREELGLSEDKLLVAAVALGYEDSNAKINSFKTPRLSPKEFTKKFS